MGFSRGPGFWGDNWFSQLPPLIIWLSCSQLSHPCFPVICLSPTLNEDVFFLLFEEVCQHPVFTFASSVRWDGGAALQSDFRGYAVQVCTQSPMRLGLPLAQAADGL